VFLVGEVQKAPQGYQVIYVAWITLRSGKRLYAASYGLKAFPLKVRK